MLKRFAKALRLIGLGIAVVLALMLTAGAVGDGVFDALMLLLDWPPKRNRENANERNSEHHTDPAHGRGRRSGMAS